MPQITAIEPQKRKKERFNIYIDGEFAFGLDAENLAKEKLQAGQKISNDTINQLIVLNEFVKVYDKVLRFLSYRPRSKKEIENYLKKQQVGSKVGELVFDKLEKYNYLDDYQFAKWWIANRLRFRPKGTNILKSELIKKGISRQIIEQVLEKVSPNLQGEVALAVARKQITKYRNLKQTEIIKKLASFLARRGFNWETINNVISQLK